MARFGAILLAAIAALGVGASPAAAFAPTNGDYRGEYTKGDHGPGDVRLRVEQLQPGLHGLRVTRWSGKLSCPGDRTDTVDIEMTAARAGRTFSGFATWPEGEYRLTGRFVSKTALKAKVRVVQGSGDDRCDTGPIRFEARLVGR